MDPTEKWWRRLHRWQATYWLMGRGRRRFRLSPSLSGAPILHVPLWPSPPHFCLSERREVWLLSLVVLGFGCLRVALCAPVVDFVSLWVALRVDTPMVLGVVWCTWSRTSGLCAHCLGSDGLGLDLCRRLAPLAQFYILILVVWQAWQLRRATIKTAPRAQAKPGQSAAEEHQKARCENHWYGCSLRHAVRGGYGRDSHHVRIRSR